MKTNMDKTINSLKAVCTLLIVLLLAPVSASAADAWEYSATKFSGGTGTQSDPYLIKTAQDLASLTYQTSNSRLSYKDFDGVYFVQTADIVLNDDVVKSAQVDAYGRANFSAPAFNTLKDWIPIGIYGAGAGFLSESPYWFKGHYDGGGHSVSGIYSYRGDLDNTLEAGNGYDNYLGLFGAVKGGSIKNLTVKDCLFRVCNVKAHSHAWRYIGAIAGKAEDEVISNCHVENTVICFEDDNTPQQTSVGGVVGYCNITDSYNDDYELTDCSFEGKINVYNDVKECSPSMGGICGTIVASDSYLNNQKNPVISNSIARGVIVYNYNNTTVPAETDVYAGGILGKFMNSSSTVGHYAQIYRCTNFVNTDVIATKSNVYAGGLSGYMARCEQSANFGNVVVNTHGGEVANVYAGGIGTFVSIDNCANYGTVTLGSVDTGYGTTVTGNAYLGTLAVCGLNSDAASTNPCHISNSTNCANVVCEGVTGTCHTDGVSVFSNASGTRENVYNFSATHTTYASVVPWDAKAEYLKYDNLSILNTNAKYNGAASDIWGQLNAPQSTFYKYIMPIAPSAVPSVQLDENDDNLLNIIENNNYDADLDNKVSVTLVRSMKSGMWNTICLPFSMTTDELKAAFGNDVKLESFNDVTVDASGALTLNFVEATTLASGKPYLIKPSKVNLDSHYVLGTYALSPSITKSTSIYVGGKVSMVGCLPKFTLKGAEAGYDEYFLQADKFYHIVPTNPISSKAFRCYFILSKSSTPLSLVKIQHANGAATAINVVKVGTTAQGNAIYDLQGIQHQRMVKGLYIKGGKKYVVK